jgi:hypothetical protein
MGLGIYDQYSDQEPNQNRKRDLMDTAVAKKLFLETFMRTAHVGKACTLIGIIPRNIYNWKQQDPEFEKAYAEAKQVALGLLEDEATRRALHGVEKPVYQGGKLAGFVTEYSDTLMIVLLKANAPEKYRERWTGELTGANGQPLQPPTVNHVHSNIPIATDEDQVDKTRMKSTLLEEAQIVSEDEEKMTLRIPKTEVATRITTELQREDNLLDDLL